jgi:hypothetical protein
VPMHFGGNNPDDAMDFCLGHTWIGGINEDNEGWYQVRANWLGPDIIQSGGTDWDCEHTSLTMAVYTMRSSQGALGNWDFRGYVSLAGSSQNGRCIYSDDSIVDELYTEPSSAEPAIMWLGDSLVGFPPTTGDGATYFSFAVTAWSHDTPDLGHQLDLCADPENCYWPFYLEAWLQ